MDAATRFPLTPRHLTYDATMTDIVDPALEQYATEHTTAPPDYLEDWPPTCGPRSSSRE